MKRLLAMLVLSVLLVSCGEYEPEENKVDIKEELKISAYLLGEEFEDNGYWAYSEDMQYPNFGYWVSDNERQYDDDEGVRARGARGRRGTDARAARV